MLTRARIVAIECATCRTNLTGSAAWSETVGYGRLRESDTRTAPGGKASLSDQEEAVCCDADRCVMVEALPTSSFVLAQS